MEQNGTCSDRSWDSPIVIKAIPKDWDVFDYPSMDKFPEVGLEKTAYIDLEANSIYRWDTTNEEYVAIGGGGGTTDYERLRNLPSVEGVVLTGDRSASDLGLAKELDLNAVEVLVPEQASEENKLADQNFVNSSIATNTAYYIYKTVDDKKVPFDSLEELEAYTGTLTNNDYAFVVGTDESGNTTYTRYKYSEATEEWAEEYVLNNSSFTAAQWAAITSGITSGKIAEINATLATIPQLLSSTGQSETAGMTQKAITDALANAGGVKVLTTDDYNWPVNNPDGVAIWKLETGFYENPKGVQIYDRAGSSSHRTVPFLITKAEYYGSSTAKYDFDITQIKVQITSKNGDQRETKYLPYIEGIKNNLATTFPDYVLDARQGKVLKDMIDALPAAPTVVQTTGTSTTDVMSQNAVTSMVYADPSTKQKVQMGGWANGAYSTTVGAKAETGTNAQASVAIGTGYDLTMVYGDYAVGIGTRASVPRSKKGSIALGSYSGDNITANGMIDVGSSWTDTGYDNTKYRLLTGVHDPVNTHDAATKGYVDANAGAEINSTDWSNLWQ